MRVVSTLSTVSNRKPSSKTQTTSNRGDRTVTTIKPSQSTLTTSWRSPSVPMWLLHLHSVQRRFGIATYILIAGMLAAYGSTVYLQQKWNQQYRQLENLQHYERQITTNNEMLKNQLAAEAEQPFTELLPPNPADAIVLQVSHQKGDRSSLQLEAPIQPKADIPAGY